MITLAIDRFPGVFAQVILLAVLSATTGIGPAAVLAGGGYAVVVAGLLAGSLRAARTRPLDPADHLTLARSVLVGGVVALVVERLHSSPPSAPLVVIAGVALLLSAVDGRRRGTEVGTWFGTELDAFLVLALSAHVATLLGPWVLIVGTLRYAAVAAGRVLPRLRGRLPRGDRAVGTVATVQGVLLLVAGVLL